MSEHRRHSLTSYATILRDDLEDRQGRVGLRRLGLSTIVACEYLLRRLYEEFAQRSPDEGIVPAPIAVLLAVVEHMTALAERGQIAWAVVGRVVIEVRAGEDDIGATERASAIPPRRRYQRCSVAVTPTAAVGVPPNAVAQMLDMA